MRIRLHNLIFVCMGLGVADGLLLCAESYQRVWELLGDR